jgi:hypothetical protein
LSTSQSPCFISDSRVCQALNPKNLVFIIGSGSDEFKEDIYAIKEVLNGFNLTGYFALLSEEEKGLDVFCDKICSKIRESKFCVVLLNTPVIKGDNRRIKKTSELIRAPSANVYYEFGMAMALEKHVVPIIRHDLKLPFDVQHLDAIIYSNLSELREKLKQAILPILSKKKKEFRTDNSKLIEKIYEPLSSILEKHAKQLEAFSSPSAQEVKDILGQTYYKMQISHGLLERLEHYTDQVEALYKMEHYARREMIGILERIVMEIFKKPYSPSDGNLRIEFKALTKTGSQLHLHPQDLLPLLLENQKIENFLRMHYWYDNYVYISINYSNDTIELDWLKFNGKIWDKCLAEVSANPRVMMFKESAKSILEETWNIIEEITEK